MYSLFVLYFIVSNNLCFSHLILNRPEVWGIQESIALEEPLDGTTSNWICAGKTPDSDAIINLVAGSTYNFETICGEKSLTASGCLIGDWHTGYSLNDYSGCALGVTYSDYMDDSSHKYISYTEVCPLRGRPTQFTISKNVENCSRCVCSWVWAPSREYSSPAQFYHNCFYCSITGGEGTQNNMKQLDFINVRGSQYSDVTYNDINRITNLLSTLYTTTPSTTPRATNTVTPRNITTPRTNTPRNITTRNSTKRPQKPKNQHGHHHRNMNCSH